ARIRYDTDAVPDSDTILRTSKSDRRTARSWWSSESGSYDKGQGTRHNSANRARRHGRLRSGAAGRSEKRLSKRKCWGWVCGRRAVAFPPRVPATAVRQGTDGAFL